jgi:hypothetical protein
MCRDDHQRDPLGPEQRGQGPEGGRRHDRRYASPYGLGSATTGAHKRGEPMATTGEKT